MDLDQLNAALSAHSHRRDLGPLSAPGLGGGQGGRSALDATALDEHHGLRAPRVAYEELFESLDELAS